MLNMLKIVLVLSAAGAAFLVAARYVLFVVTRD